MKRASVIALLVLASGTQAAIGRDGTELKMLGFSPDGRHFAFEQHGAIKGSTYSVTTVIDVETGRPVKGSRTSYGDEDRKRLASIGKETARQIRRLRISQKGIMTVSVRGHDVEPFDEASVKSFAMPRSWFGPESWLVLRQFKMAARCGTANASPVGFGLTLEREGSPAVRLSQDVAIPLSRGCPRVYRIADVHARKAPDGSTALVVLVQNSTPGVDPLYSFIPVSARIPQPAAARAQ